MRPAKILCAAFALACAGSAPACAWFGKSPENLEEPAAPAAAPAASSASGARALLWVPDPRKLDWEGLRGLLEREEAARFTLALAPEDIPEAAQLWLAQAVQEGRLEVALRLAGDPILPLAASTQNPWIFERLASSRQSLSRILGRPPSGFVPGRGAASPEVAAALLEASEQGEAYAVEALFSPPPVSRASRGYITVFINLTICTISTYIGDCLLYADGRLL